MITAAATIDRLSQTHKAAAAEREAVHAREREAAARVSRLMQALIIGGVDLPTVEIDDRIAADIELPSARREWKQRWLDTRAADKAEAAARAALRDAIAKQAHARRKQVVSELAPLLLRAQALADQLAQLEQESPLGDQIGWPILMSSTDRFTSQLDCWLPRVRELGLLD